MVQFIADHIFQSTLPVGGATLCAGFTVLDSQISIHAPRGGSDLAQSGLVRSPCDFNPRSPWGERPFASAMALRYSYFNPRSPWGERRICTARPLICESFQSTLPVGGATDKPATAIPIQIISIHAPRGGSDIRWIPLSAKLCISIHAPRGGSDFSGLSRTSFHP